MADYKRESNDALLSIVFAASRPLGCRGTHRLVHQPLRPHRPPLLHHLDPRRPAPSDRQEPATARPPRRPHRLNDEVRGFRTRPLVLTWALCGWLVFVDEAAEDGSAPDPSLGEIAGWVVGPGRV